MAEPEAALHLNNDAAPRRLPRALRERQLLSLGEELFLERGFAAASMDELARRAGVSKPVIYALFGSKEQLFRSTVAHAAEELSQRIGAAVDGVDGLGDRLRAGAVAFFRFVEDHRRAWAALLSTAAGAQAAIEIVETRRREAGQVRAVLQSAAPGADDDVRIDVVAHALTGAFEAAATWWQDHPGVSAEALADWMVTLMLPGVEALALAAGAGAGRAG